MRDGQQRPAVAVLLPGSGSDHVFVTAVFEQPLAALGIRLIAPPPEPGAGVVSAMWQALDAATGSGTPASATDSGTPASATGSGAPGSAAGRVAPDAGAGPGVLVGGISLGAHVAASWAARNPGRCAGLLLALPAWLGGPGDAPAAVSAAATARAVRRDGMDACIGQVRADAPSWVADELDRAWRRHGAGLADALHAAARTPAPTVDDLRTLAVPAGIAALTDDPVHPLATARQWANALPRAAMVTTSLHAVGRDRAALGRAALQAWLRAATPGESPVPCR